jgi:flagellar biosynthesis/type III secretory pathway M-ring protein FliF/YscJ
MNGLAFALLIFLVIGFLYMIYIRGRCRSNSARSSRCKRTRTERARSDHDTDTSSVASGDSDMSDGSSKSNKRYDLYGEIRSFMGKQAAYLGT